VGGYREGGINYVAAPWIINNYGFAPGYELVLEGRHFLQMNGADKGTSTILEPQFFLKMLLREGSLQDGEGLSVATELGPYFPELHTVQNGFGAQVGIIVSQKWPDLVVHFNVVDYLSRAHHFGLFTSIIVEGPWRWRVRPVFEVLADREYRSTDFRTGLERSVLGGAIWSVIEGFSLDLGVRVGAVEDRPMQELRLGFTWGVEVVAPPHEPPARD
jgi:hypothetical protein